MKDKKNCLPLFSAYRQGRKLDLTHKVYVLKMLASGAYLLINNGTNG